MPRVSREHETYPAASLNTESSQPKKGPEDHRQWTCAYFVRRPLRHPKSPARDQKFEHPDGLFWVMTLKAHCLGRSSLNSDVRISPNTKKSVTVNKDCSERSGGLLGERDGPAGTSRSPILTSGFQVKGRRSASRPRPHHLDDPGLPPTRTGGFQAPAPSTQPIQNMPSTSRKQPVVVSSKLPARHAAPGTPTCPPMRTGAFHGPVPSTKRVLTIPSQGVL